MLAFRVERNGKGPFTDRDIYDTLTGHYLEQDSPERNHPNPATDLIVENYEQYHDPFPDKKILFACPDIGSIKHWFGTVLVSLQVKGFKLLGLRLKKGKLGLSEIQLGFYPNDVIETVEFQVSEDGLVAAAEWALRNGK